MLRIIRLVANICVTKFQQEFFCLNQVYIRKIGDKEQSPAHIPNLPRIPQSHWGRLRSSLSPKPARRKNGWRDGGVGGDAAPGRILEVILRIKRSSYSFLGPKTVLCSFC